MPMVPSLLLRRGASPVLILGATVLTLSALHSDRCAAQSTTVPGRAREARTFSWSTDRGADQRAVLGIALRTDGSRDTLGVFVAEVTPEGPAAKAGLTDGARIVAINGVSLRVSAADIDDPELRGIGERRLRRELAKVEPGSEVELRVVADGAARTVRVKTVAASALDDAPVRVTRTSLDTRPFLGLTVSSTGTPRDTLGLFISSVTTDGPAEKLGIVEGERIRSINGVDVRVPREDAGDWTMASARASRFTRTLRAAKPGDVITLEVLSGGRTRTVAVTAGKASDFSGRSRGWQMQIGDDAAFFSGQGAATGIGALRPLEIELDRLGEDLQLRFDGLRIDGEEMGRRIGDEMRRAFGSVRESMPRVDVEREPGRVRVRTVPRVRRITL
jgi:predicted metalloprotease with PDZ domain